MTIFAILLKIHTLQLEMAKRDVLMWCPGHSNIFSNEQVDKAAGSGVQTPPFLNPITTYQDLKAETNNIFTKYFKE
jgi:ribonuclease HI